MPDTLKLLAGPILALVPILVWETLIKPQRVRRSASRLLLTELALNLDELAYLRLRLRTAPTLLPVNMNLTRVAFDALAASMGELPPPAIEGVIRYYAYAARLESTLAQIRFFRDKRDSVIGAMLDEVDNAATEGMKTLRVSAEATFESCLAARTHLFEVLRNDWVEEPAPLPSLEAVEQKPLRRAALREAARRAT